MTLLLPDKQAHLPLGLYVGRLLTEHIRHLSVLGTDSSRESTLECGGERPKSTPASWLRSLKAFKCTAGARSGRFSRLCISSSQADTPDLTGKAPLRPRGTGNSTRPTASDSSLPTDVFPFLRSCSAGMACISMSRIQSGKFPH